MFGKNKYNYAVRAVVTGHKRVDADTATVKVQVEEVLFCGRVKFPRSNHVTLWTNGTCACPELRAGQTYLMAGHEDVSNGRFLLNPSTALTVTWKDKWSARVKHWHRRLQKQRETTTPRGDKSQTTSVTPTNRKRGRKRKNPGKASSTSRRKSSSRPNTTERKPLLTNKNLTLR